MKRPRNPNVTQTFGRKTGPFKDQRKGKGGSQNTQKEYSADYEAASLSLSFDKHEYCDCMSCLPWNY